MASGSEEDVPGPMRYRMLGEDAATSHDKLAKYAGRADWQDLKAHLASGTLIYVDPSLDLREVGLVFSRDDRDRVAAWMKKGDLVIPSQPHGEYWESIGAVFECQVVSPFVLIQAIES